VGIGWMLSLGGGAAPNPMPKQAIVIPTPTMGQTQGNDPTNQRSEVFGDKPTVIAPTPTFPIVATIATDTPVSLPASTPIPPTIPPATSSNCPVWYVTPEPGKGVVVIENHNTIYEIEIGGNALAGTGVGIKPKQGDVPGRLVFSSNPPSGYIFIKYMGRTGNFAGSVTYESDSLNFSISSGQMLVVPITGDEPRGGLKIYPLTIPEGCP